MLKIKPLLSVLVRNKIPESDELHKAWVADRFPDPMPDQPKDKATQTPPPLPQQETRIIPFRT